MPLKDVPTIAQTIDIDAAPGAVWELVRDPRHMKRWSPQTAVSILRGGDTVAEGARFLNINRRGLLVWPTRSKVVRFTPGQEIAWRVKDNFTVWSLKVAPNAAGGTTLTQSREAPQGISDISVTLTKRFFGGVESFNEELRGDMLKTLTRIKADAERATA